MTEEKKEQAVENHLFDSLSGLMEELEESFQRNDEFEITRNLLLKIRQIEKEIYILKKGDG